MKTIHRFVLKSYFGPMILSFLIVMFVLMMNFVWRYIDELVGKGLDYSVIGELIFYAALTMIPMGLPLSMLFAAIMTMGNLGENYELLAMKSSGMSLLAILKPLIVITFFIAIGSFFITNNLVPYSTQKMYGLIFDIKQKRQAIEFKDGVFFNGIENMSIRVSSQDSKTKLLTDVLIYDTRDRSGDMTTTVADSGYISMSEDKRYLKVTLYDGETYEQTRNRNWDDKNTLSHHIFTMQKGIIPLEGFDFERTDTDLFNSSQTKKIEELAHGIDSLQRYSDQANAKSYEPLLERYVFKYNKGLVSDSLKMLDTISKIPMAVFDSIATLDIYERKKILSNAKSSAYSSRSLLSFDENMAKEALNQLYRYKADWHRKLSLPVSIMIFFLIGASLGAIIRKGGLGMPIVVSILFFVIYYMISVTGEKMAKEGTWEAYIGMWISSIILAPLAAFLMYKATNDSNLFNVDNYLGVYLKLKEYVLNLVNKIKNIYGTIRKKVK